MKYALSWITIYGDSLRGSYNLWTTELDWEDEHNFSALKVKMSPRKSNKTVSNMRNLNWPKFIAKMVILPSENILIVITYIKYYLLWHFNNPSFLNWWVAGQFRVGHERVRTKVKPFGATCFERRHLFYNTAHVQLPFVAHVVMTATSTTNVLASKVTSCSFEHL